MVLERRYFLRRKRAELASAEEATSAEARLIHFDLAGRYSVKASIASAELRQPTSAASSETSHVSDLLIKPTTAKTVRYRPDRAPYRPR
jgi:hypothetical protein